jgi:hypothetical protein
MNERKNFFLKAIGSARRRPRFVASQIEEFDFDELCLMAAAPTVMLRHVDELHKIISRDVIFVTVKISAIQIVNLGRHDGQHCLLLLQMG